MVPLVVLHKAHGLGNDYLIWVSGPALHADLVQRVCDRHRGVGGDGILEPTPTHRADHGVRIWNPDGSVAEKSGNGLRILAHWLATARDAGPSFHVDTGHDVVHCEVQGTHVIVEMGEATIQALQQPLALPHGDVVVTTVSVGNPHAVWFADDDLDALPWREWGSQIEVHPTFTNRTNVQFARVVGPRTCEARVWERGAGETQASGSSACAVAAAAVARDLQPVNAPIAVRMPGGALEVTVRDDRTVRLAGPVAPIAEIRLDPRWLLSSS